jgi:hypothetical protein
LRYLAKALAKTSRCGLLGLGDDEIATLNANRIRR